MEINLMEVMWKVVAEILNFRITASITFHNFFHGFWAGRGTGTTTLEANLFQQLVTLREEILYVIFLDLHKAYDTLDRSRCLDILEGYSVVPPIQAATTDVLEAANDGRNGGWLLRDGVPGSARGDAGRSALTHHI